MNRSVSLTTLSGIHWIKLWWRCCRALGDAGVRDPREGRGHLGSLHRGLARLRVTVWVNHWLWPTTHGASAPAPAAP